MLTYRQDGERREVRRMENLEKRLAAIENEQLIIKKYLQEVVDLDKWLIKTVKEIWSNVEKLETIDTNGTE